jgi:hypothetical protein
MIPLKPMVKRVHYNIGEKEEIFGQSIWDKSVGLIGKMLGSTLRTLWELFGNMVGTPQS